MPWLNAMVSCGCRCQDGLVIGNGTTPVNIDEFYYLATVNDTVTDDYGRTFPGNSAFNQSEQSVQCWNDSSTIFVHIIDSCPAYQVCQCDINSGAKSYWKHQSKVCTSLGLHLSNHPAVLQLCVAACITREITNWHRLKAVQVNVTPQVLHPCSTVYLHMHCWNVQMMP